MKNIIKISTDKSNKTIKADEYMVIGQAGNTLEMTTNLTPDNLLLFLMPLLIELDERFKIENDDPIYNN